jgi:hypothetical protein
MQPRHYKLIPLVLTLSYANCISAAELPDLSTTPKDLFTPAMIEAAPAAGKRVKQITPGWEQGSIYHTLYLPANWQPGRKYPVLFEYAGNGGYSNKFGDISLGVPEGSNLGYGISGGTNFIWVCLPFIAVTNGTKTIATKWWGNADETIRYCTNTVRFICDEFGGNTNALVLCGFSRGAIACNYIGLHNDHIAPLWRAFIAHSHYDGVLTGWPYAKADQASALARLDRLNGRPQFISHEGSIDSTRAWLVKTDVKRHFTYAPIPFRNHSDEWVLRDLPERRQLRQWLQEVLER